MSQEILRCSVLLLLAGCAAPSDTLRATPLRIMPLGDSLPAGFDQSPAGSDSGGIPDATLQSAHYGTVPGGFRRFGQ